MQRVHVALILLTLELSDYLRVRLSYSRLRLVLVFEALAADHPAEVEVRVNQVSEV